MPEACGSSGIGMVYSAASCRNADTLANGSICVFPPGLAIGERVRVSAPFVRRARPADGRQRSKLAARFKSRYAVERWSPLPSADLMLDSMQWDNHGMHRSGGGAVFSNSRRSPPPGDANRYPTGRVEMRGLHARALVRVISCPKLVRCPCVRRLVRSILCPTIGALPQCSTIGCA
ncbi:hypothetical protein Poly51_59070 [Rubripirellula tenax]|uniref:Uncharacterized protein n=1 Tax=Rubripirellula tenax TaxID=2528015 RepID=A0A5C6E715_9BACT|nr:hypothetical protein Poly51_59070 [Rubripirellula tenax]